MLRLQKISSLFDDPDINIIQVPSTCTVTANWVWLWSLGLLLLISSLFVSLFVLHLLRSTLFLTIFLSYFAAGRPCCEPPSMELPVSISVVQWLESESFICVSAWRVCCRLCLDSYWSFWRHLMRKLPPSRDNSPNNAIEKLWESSARGGGDYSVAGEIIPRGDWEYYPRVISWGSGDYRGGDVDVTLSRPLVISWGSDDYRRGEGSVTSSRPLDVIIYFSESPSFLANKSTNLGNVCDTAASTHTRVTIRTYGIRSSLRDRF